MNVLAIPTQPLILNSTVGTYQEHFLISEIMYLYTKTSTQGCDL